MAALQEQWESRLLAGRSGRLITDRDVPQENYLTLLFFHMWTAHSNANHLPGEQARPIPVINWTLFSAQRGRCPPAIVGRVQIEPSV